MRLNVTVNGESRQADDVWEGESLLYVLRERLGLPGSKNACEQGECGSCTVYLDGVPVCACLVAAGPGRGPRGAHGRRAWPTATRSTRSSSPSSTRARCSAVSARRAWSWPRTTCWTACPSPSDAEIREALAGNLCRCTGYEKILDAVRLAAKRGGARAMTHHRKTARSPPWTPAGPSTRDGHVVVEDERIVAVGDRPRRATIDERRSTRTGCLVTPGLVNTHHHLYQWATRGLAADQTLFELAGRAVPGLGAASTPRSRTPRPPPGWRWLALTGCTTVADHHYVFPRDGGDLLAALVAAARSGSACGCTSCAGRWTAASPTAGCRRTTWSRTPTRR